MHKLEELKNIFHLRPGSDAPRFVIYTPELSPRLEYVCGFIFTHVLRVHHRLSTNAADLQTKNDFAVNYSQRDIPGAYRIRPHKLLFETGVAARAPEPFFADGQLYLYHNVEGASGLHFDLFSAVFYFISRMEEWQDHEKDRHGRFEARASLLFRHKLHLKPVVDQWICGFGLGLRRLYPELKLPSRIFRLVSTIDVDNLYAYRNKGFIRTLGGAARDLMRGDVGAVAERAAVVCGLRNDPFDIYESVSRFCADHDVPLFWFFLVRSGTRYDRTIDPARGAFRPVIGKLAGKHFVGLHPSYDSSVDPRLLSEEIRLLKEQGLHEVEFSRQHFLRFSIRSTPGQLHRQGIAADFSMGFASVSGFRAGTTHPFHYFDLENEKPLPLLFIPFCTMDGAYTFYSDTDPRAAMVEQLAMAAEIRSAGGFFTSVFHERTFSNRLYRGYGTLYKNLLIKLKEMERQ